MMAREGIIIIHWGAPRDCKSISSAQEDLVVQILFNDQSERGCKVSPCYMIVYDDDQNESLTVLAQVDVCWKTKIKSHLYI